MRTFVLSLKMLYDSGSKAVTKETLERFLKSGKITKEEYDYIVG